MPATHILATEDPDLLAAWQRQLPPEQLSLPLANGLLPASMGAGVPVVLVIDAGLMTRWQGALPPEAPTLVVGEPRSLPFEQARLAGRGLVYLSYEDSRSRLGEFLPLLREIAERGAALGRAVERSRRSEGSRAPFRLSSPGDHLEMWDFIEGAVENLGSRERLLAEFRRASRYLLRASHAVFFLREKGGFRADRGESFCPIDDPMVSYLSQHPAVLDGVDWPGPPDPVAELAVRHRLALWGARLLVPMHDNGRLLGMIAFGVRDDGQPFDGADHGRAVFVARLLRQFLNQSAQLTSLNGHYETARLGERYLPQTLILVADEQPAKQVPLAVRALIGESRRTNETRRIYPRFDQPFRASAGVIVETGGTWAVWEEASSEVFDQTQRSRASRLDLLRDLALTMNHEIGNALVSLSALRHASGGQTPTPGILKAASDDIGRIEALNRALVRLSTLTEAHREEVDLRVMLQAIGAAREMQVEVGPDPVAMGVAADLLRFALESIVDTVAENRPDLGTRQLSLQLRATGEGKDLTALVSLKGKLLELEGVLPLPAPDAVPNHGRVGVFIAREVLRMHGGEIHAGPGLEGTEILISICAWQ